MFNHIIGAMTAQHSLSSCFLKILLHLNMLSWDVWLPVRSTRLCVGGVEISNLRPNMKSHIAMLQCNLSTSVSSKMIISPFGENLRQHHCYEIKETNVWCLKTQPVQHKIFLYMMNTKLLHNQATQYNILWRWGWSLEWWCSAVQFSAVVSSAVAFSKVVFSAVH